MFTHAMTAILVISLGQTPPGSSKEPPQPPPKKATTQKAEEKTEKQGKPAPQEGKREARPTNLAVKAMNMVIEDAVFEDLTFEEFVEWLGRTTKANVVVRWKVLEKEGIERDQPINLKEKNIPIRKLLPMVFEQLTADLRSVELAAKADGNTLMISTKQELTMQLITRMYDVQDLLISLPKFPATPVGGGLTRYSDRVKMGGSGWKESDANSEDPAEQLINVITRNIQPLSWKVNGGKGTIKILKGQLVIRNNIEVHQELGGYLAATKAVREAAGQ